MSRPTDEDLSEVAEQRAVDEDARMAVVMNLPPSEDYVRTRYANRRKDAAKVAP